MVMLRRYQECDGGSKHERMKRPRPRRNERRVTTRPGLVCSSPGLCRTCREATEVAPSGEGNEIEVAVVPQVLVGVG